MDISIEHRLKTIDMMSILVDIQTELYEELYEVDNNDTLSPRQEAWNDALYKAGNIVQKKFNDLKDGRDNDK